MSVSETQFRAALLDADAPVPAGLTGPDGAPAGARYDVYRNNVAVSLREALATAFPLVARLLGAGNFNGIAAIYATRYPPDSPLMMHYGAGFPDFLQGFQPLANLGYLPDCARLDLALRRSYHASDATPLDPKVLQVPPQTLADLHLSPAPATQVLRSAWPIFDLWRYNYTPGAPKPRSVAQDVLITRPEYDPDPHLLPPGAATWLEALARGRTLGEAHEDTLGETPGFDLSEALTLALQTNALISTPQKEKKP